MTYPPREQTSVSRVVTMTYGSGDIDDALSRVTRIADTTGASPERAIDFEHAGSSRRVGRTWLDDIGGTLTAFLEQTLDDGVADGYAALDRRGRVTDLHFTLAAGGSTVHRYEYGYDSAGNRLFERVVQAGEDNSRSWLYGYDNLGRLRSAERGELNASNDAIVLSQSLASLRVDWGLDRLGNWTEPAAGHEGRVETQDLDGLPGYEDLVLAADHSTDLRNELTNVNEDDGSGPVSTPHVHDATGNLVADGTYFYQFDAFNRLAAVHELGSLGFGAGGIPDSGTPGEWRATFAYDALGRRVAKESPWDGPSAEHRTAWYHYDGVRRIVEVHKDPLTGGPGGIGGAPPGGGGGGSHVVYTDREYVWGPDYVDECLWQIDRPGNELFVLQDANFNVVGLVDETGAVLQQYDYDAYGSPMAVDEPVASANNRIGHQGLFIDRYDADAPNPEMAVGADVTMYARNRDYQPELGRWVQRDPNGTSLALLSELPPEQSLDDSLDTLSISLLFTDGIGIHSFVASNPLSRTDPKGLEFGLTSLVSNLLSRPIIGNVAIHGGRIALNVADDILMGYSGTSMGFGLIGGGSIVGAGLFDDLLGRLPRFFVSDYAAASHQNFRRAMGKYGDPNGLFAVPREFIAEVIDEARRLGFTSIRTEQGGSRSGSWTGVWHINMRVPNGGRELHIKIEGP